MKYLILVVLALQGCAYLSKAEDRSADGIAKAVKEYCKSTDAEFRDRFRGLVNAKATPNSLEVTCK